MENDKLVRASDIFPALQSAGVPYNYATRRVIEQLPAVDAVEVIRCRECKHRYYYEEEDIAPVCTASMAYANTPDDWFCKDGQRR